MTKDEAEELRRACKVVLAAGFTPVEADAYARLRAWCDQNGWPPAGWTPPGSD